MYSTYLRLGLHVADSNITVIRATYRIMNKKSRRDPGLRESRKTAYRTMLRYHREANNLYRDVMLGQLDGE